MLRFILTLAMASVSAIPSTNTYAPETQSPIPATPYRMIIQFDDGSLEVCPTKSFTIDYTTLHMNVSTCHPDKIFSNGFEE